MNIEYLKKIELKILIKNKFDFLVEFLYRLKNKKESCIKILSFWYKNLSYDNTGIILFLNLIMSINSLYKYMHRINEYNMFIHLEFTLNQKLH